MASSRLLRPAADRNLISTNEDEVMPSTSDDSATWADMRLVAVAAVEVQPLGQLTMDQLRYTEKFEQSWNEHMKRLHEMNIKIDVKLFEKDEKTRKSEETTEAAVEIAGTAKNAKVKKVADMVQGESLLGRWSDLAPPSAVFSVRSPLEIALAYFPQPTIRDPTEVAMRMTSLDLQGLKLTKLSGIDGLPSLQHLSLRNNKITSVKKLFRLPSLRSLDIACNLVIKIEHLPSSIISLDISQNRIQHLTFCHSLTNITQLRVQQNQLKSLKGVENCQLLEIFCAADNQIKDKSELEIVKNFSKLWHLDLSGNLACAFDGFRSKVLQISPFLLSLDGEMIPADERCVATKQTSRGLSIDLIDKMCGEWQNKSELMLRDQKIELIVLEKSQIEALSHIRLLDLSRNKITNARDLSPLHITHLVLSHNNVRSISANELNFQPFANLQILDLTSNSINNLVLSRLGLQHVQTIREVNLAANLLTKFDCTLFDLPNLESLDLSNNQIKTITRRPLRSLLCLSIESNRLTTLNGLAVPNLAILNAAGNKLASCASLKPVCDMKSLHTLDFRRNVVTERRVYVDFIRSHCPTVTKLDGEAVDMQIIRRKMSRAELSLSRRPSMVSSSLFDMSWTTKEEEAIEQEEKLISTLRVPRRLEPIVVNKIEGNEVRRPVIDSEFLLLGTRVVQHKKF